MRDSLFIEHTMKRFNDLENILQQGSKGIHHISSHLTLFCKAMEMFRVGLEHSIKPLKDFWSLSKLKEDSLTRAVLITKTNIEEFCNYIKKTCDAYTNNVIGSFNLFKKTYNDLNEDAIISCEKIIEILETQKKKVKKVKTSYAKAAKNLYISKDTEIKGRAVKEAKSKYKEAVNEYNKLLMEKYNEYRSKLEVLGQNEQMRINLIAKNIGKSMEILDDVMSYYRQLAVKVINSLDHVNVISDVCMCVEGIANNNEIHTFDKLPIDDYGDLYQLISVLNEEGQYKNCEELIVSDKQLNTKQIQEDITSSCNKLLESNPLSNEEFLEINRHLSSSFGRLCFAHVLAQIKIKYYIENFTAFDTLTQIINNLLTMISLHDDNNAFTLATTLSVSFLIYSRKTNLKGQSVEILLRELIGQNTLWLKPDKWIHIIQYRIEKALSQEASTAKEEKKTINSRHNSVRRRIICMQLALAGGQMTLIRIDRQIGMEILLQFAVYYHINNEKLYEILLDYESAQVLPRDIDLNPNEIKTIIKERYNHKMEKYNEDYLFIIGNTMRYVNDYKTLLNVLMINKTVYRVLKNRVYKKVLRLSVRNMEVRKEIWKLVILDKELCKEKKIVMENMESITKLIKLDVCRSFYMYDIETQQVLITLYIRL